MVLNIGVIGVGMIGQDHIRRLTQVLAGARSSRSPTSTAHAPQDGRRSPAGGQGVPGRRGAHRRRLRRRRPRHLLGTDARAVRAGVHRRRQARLLREAARRPRRRPACASSTPRSRRARGSSRSASCAATTRRYRALKSTARQRSHRRAADHARGAPQPRRSRAATPPTWPSSTPPCTTSTSSGGCFGEEIAAVTVLGRARAARGRSAAGPAARPHGDGRRGAGRRRDLGQHPLRLRHPRRGGRRDGHRHAREPRRSS